MVRGSLQALQGSGGDFSTSTSLCFVNNTPATATSAAFNPSSGGGVWYAVRGVNLGGLGTFNEPGTSQQGTRDAEILTSGVGCP